MRYKKPNIFCYRLAQAVCFAVATIIFKRKMLRNEIKNKKGPFVVIANHQAAYDFVNLIGARKEPMSFVISNSFYSSLPIKRFFDELGVIPKQQFQTTVKDMKDIKAVIDHGKALVIYPAGLMCEDGVSTPIPDATYKFLRWLGVDVYVARTKGTYFAMPKWSKGMRAGKTFMDIYKLFSAEEIKTADLSYIKEKTDEALLFDAYREQEELLIKYKKHNDIVGLENVLYICPHCKTEFGISVKGGNTLCCEKCGYEAYSDQYSFLHNKKGIGKEIRYVSDWSKMIFASVKEQIKNGELSELKSNAVIKMVDNKKHKFTVAGQGEVTLNSQGFTLRGNINGKETELFASINGIPTLPFSPGKYFEIQQGSDIYRCELSDGKQVMKFINAVKSYYELSKEEVIR
ncbi:MAG: 1-acyl-sn-glycerol-3-phosphate acyltransferase [Clostridia bacterium]|nr:1-acyl-sn-glycerol-3-phosphate acyltransferase [Clostridia bacterium]